MTLLDGVPYSHVDLLNITRHRRNQSARYAFRILDREAGQLDKLQIQRYGLLRNRPPAFFSENVGSLSTTLARVREVSLRTEDHGDTVLQTVIYELNQ